MRSFYTLAAFFSALSLVVLSVPIESHAFLITHSATGTVSQNSGVTSVLGGPGSRISATWAFDSQAPNVVTGIDFLAEYPALSEQISEYLWRLPNRPAWRR